MSGKELFEYAVIRWVPRVEREELLNDGVMLYCRGQHFLEMKYHLSAKRLRGFYPSSDLEELEDCLRSFQLICKGASTGGAIAALPLADRFRWLTAKRSTIIQVSAVHPGFCTDAADRLA